MTSPYNYWLRLLSLYAIFVVVAVIVMILQDSIISISTGALRVPEQQARDRGSGRDAGIGDPFDERLASPRAELPLGVAEFERRSNARRRHRESALHADPAARLQRHRHRHLLRWNSLQSYLVCLFSVGLVVQ